MASVFPVDLKVKHCLVKVSRKGRGVAHGEGKNAHPCLAACITLFFYRVFAGQAVGIKEVHGDIWLASFMDYASIGRLGCSNRLKIRSAQKCYPCLRYVV